MEERIREILEEKLKEASEYLNDISDDFVNEYDLEDIAYFCDSIHDYADGRVDIHYSDLKEALDDSDIMDYMQEAIYEGFVDTKNYDVYGHIQAAEYLYYEHQLYNCIEEISLALVCKYILDNYEDIDITDDMLDRIFELDYNQNDNLKNEVDEIITE